ncbi:MAG TPA: SAM-dependent methyltransferase [Streptosporangiaceae bacterium]|nr:SAM-dependent methyltransferase [Streptosporangiaceae bacterium]
MTAGGGFGQVDTSVPHIARIQNYWRGGKDNFAADREAAEHIMAAYPDLVHSVRANREFLARSVRYLATDAGVRQFLDIGTGLPAAGSAHEVAQTVADGCRVVYVDNDPVVLAHARALLTGGRPGAVDYIDADLRDTGRLIDQAAATLDFSEPVAVLLISVLHLIEDLDDPHGIVETLMEATPPGSFLALTHVAADIEPEAMAEMAHRMNQRVGQRATPRDHATVAGFFSGLELVPPGVVRVPEWRPDSPQDAASPSTQWGGAGRRA